MTMTDKNVGQTKDNIQKNFGLHPKMVDELMYGNKETDWRRHVHAMWHLDPTPTLEYIRSRLDLKKCGLQQDKEVAFRCFSCRGQMFLTLIYFSRPVVWVMMHCLKIFGFASHSPLSCI
ncbi:hypothetical protein GDO81_004256 [Engystomops pustulosus]|nr:hypothetical protein GDO81_004256 [Engystomops pustulosus]